MSLPENPYLHISEKTAFKAFDEGQQSLIDEGWVRKPECLRGIDTPNCAQCDQLFRSGCAKLDEPIDLRSEWLQERKG